MYPISSLGALFLEFLGCLAVIYMLYRAITEPKLALMIVGQLTWLLGTVYGSAILAVKLFPGENSFLRGAASGVIILMVGNWLFKRFWKRRNV
jgi:hypothetical protein